VIVSHFVAFTLKMLSSV